MPEPQETSRLPHQHDNVYTITDLLTDCVDKVVEKNEEEPTSGENGVSSKKTNHNLGVFLAASGALFYSWTITATNLLQDQDYFTVAMYRGIILCLPNFMYIAWNQLDMFPSGKVKLIVFRALAGMVGTFFSFTSIQSLPISESATLLQMTPVFVTIIGVLFMKQKCSVFTTVIILITMIGVVLVANPLKMVAELETTTVLTQVIGISAGLMTDIIYAAIIIVLRSLRTVNVAIIISYLGVVTTLVGLIGCAAQRRLQITTDLTTLLLLLSIGVTYLLGQICVSSALKYEESAVVSMVQVSQVLFCSLLQIFLLKKSIAILEAAGIVVIAVAVLLLGFQRYLLGLSETSILKQRFSFLLR